MTGLNETHRNIQSEIVDLSVSFASLIDNFRKLRNPICESRQNVPKATSELDKISAQTEEAAQKMLDVVEQITRREEEIIGFLERTRERAQRGDVSDLTEEIDGMIHRANGNLNDVFMIMHALQFQDITSQQMDHVAALLEDIEIKLHNIVSVFGNTEGEDQELPEPATRKTRSFDPHADLGQQTRQEDIDSLFDKKET
jgi:chemotaxis regulatin CheY-phosphate phosphatase CheZ